MPSAFGHALVGFTVANASSERRLLLLLLLPICAALPDLDVLAFRLDVPYAHPFGHRGFTHSLLFAALVGLVGSMTIRTARRWRTAALFFLATASHGVLDAMTSGGLGVGFFVPFSSVRYFLPWRPIHVSPLSVGRFFTGQGLTILRSEALWIGLPCLGVLVGRRLRRI